MGGIADDLCMSAESRPALSGPAPISPGEAITAAAHVG